MSPKSILKSRWEALKKEKNLSPYVAQADFYKNLNRGIQKVEIQDIKLYVS